MPEREVELAMYHYEQRKRDLLREAKIQQLLRETQHDPARIQRGWQTLLRDLLMLNTS
jgi:hypothetical protein